MQASYLQELLNINDDLVYKIQEVTFIRPTTDVFEDYAMEKTLDHERVYLIARTHTGGPNIQNNMVENADLTRHPRYVGVYHDIDRFDLYFVYELPEDFKVPEGVCYLNSENYNQIIH